MNTWVVRELGSEVAAKLRKPRRLLWVTGSSGMGWLRQAAVTYGSACMPNWAMKPSITRKKRASSKYPFLTST